MTIFIEVDTQHGVQVLNVSDIRRICEGGKSQDGNTQCFIITSECQWKVKRKSYIAILALLRAAGATLVTATSIPGAPNPINP